jgi:Ca2+-transporting ATPase
MTIVKLYVPGLEIDVQGDGYKPVGAMTAEDKKIEAGDEPALYRLLEIQALCNDARLEHIVEDGTDEWREIGDPPEGAMIDAAAKAGLHYDALNQTMPDCRKSHLIPNGS